MFPEDPDPIGDMQCILSVKSSIPFLVESKNFPVSFSEHMYFTDREVGEYINVPSNLKASFGMNIFLKRMEVSEVGGLLIFKISSADYPEMEVFRELVSIPSAVIDYKFIEQGYHKTLFTFHHSHMQEVTRFIFNARRALGNGVPEYLGPNRKFRGVMELAARSEGLWSGVISARSPEGESEEMEKLFSASWARRPRFTGGEETNDFLYRIHGPQVAEGGIFECISVEDGVYRALTASNVSQFYSRKLFQNYNPMLYQYHEFDGETLRICGVVSESYIKTFLESVSEAREKFPEYDIRLAYFDSLAKP